MKIEIKISVLLHVLPLAIRNFGIKSTFQSRPRPVSAGGAGKLNFE
jgi:hypothetical protein